MCFEAVEPCCSTIVSALVPSSGIKNSITAAGYNQTLSHVFHIVCGYSVFYSSLYLIICITVHDIDLF